MSRHLVAVVGPSGAGKDLLMVLACKARPDLRAARRVITRPSEAGGEDFEGVSDAEFTARAQAGAFALHWRAHGLGYGIPVEALSGDGTLLFNASRAVLAEAQARFPDLAVVLVTAPPEVLARRLAGRGRESGPDQAARLARADFPLPPGITPRIVINDSTPAEGLARFLAALQPERA
ncbi:phosphonate metabolism protein/1,5-bisphosphokinase (PRPP-forming) PhnN (plasmid) [Paracoccus kondratievae]|uniref:phosphonate metabolism protein/1,5-bisphosphokinase (PRPP-forming) PhnN n=1 Tax=Paracoccus TaxID=265 RepID=UPI000225EE31|nr:MULTISPECIES: phosphonate metabolism protein/1,5-bisphosphokinase (PRPP-forming) PhnN [Paracoccus]QFQ89704.1 phosphonate metabolism protein/1,5-bisphosphokinase (PRPP-forming) PhnN [Paracoccus kondratievae]